MGQKVLSSSSTASGFGLSELVFDSESDFDISDARVLIVDDDTGMRVMCRTALEPEGYDLYEAADGEEALHVYGEVQPDLILMDALMPRLPGIAAVERIRAQPEGRDVPILIITGVNDEDSANRAFEVGATDFIAKPVNWAVLRQRVRRTILGRRAERRVAHLAYHDTLTGLPNRRLFLDRLGNAIARANRDGHHIALLFIDLDDFKIVNDKLGHEAGDSLLATVAERLCKAVRECDTVARFGGDEFNILLDNIRTPKDVATIAETVSRSLKNPTRIGKDEVSCSGSIGVALFPDDAKDVGSLIKCADRAMYRAKEIGHGRYEFYQADLGATAMRRLLLEAHLHSSIENDELRLFYQPQINLASNAIIAHEALLRWEHQSLGLVNARDFIDLADEIGLSAQVVRWVMHTAVKQQAQWVHKHALNTRLALNVSMAQLRTPNLVAYLADLLHTHRIEAGQIDVEISETWSGFLTEQVAEAIRQFDDLGCRVILDDFGTNSMSITALRELPIAAVKLDRSIVKGIGENPKRVVICRAIAALVRELDITLIAEGVEHQGDLDELKRLGCVEAQGYLLGRPVEAHDLLSEPLAIYG